MKIAVIDCGTNTFNLIILRVAQTGAYERLYQARIPVKLGEKSINEKLITDAAIQRGLDALAQFRTAIDKHHVDLVHALATSAIRDASNGPHFIAQAFARSGIKVVIIDGDNEAMLIYKGIREAVKMQDDLSMIMDIGGGSTEFIIASRHEVKWKHSFNIGAARILEKFAPSEPITPAQVKSIFNYLDEQLAELFIAIQKYKPVELIGSSGAFESILEMSYARNGKGEPDAANTEFTMLIDSYNEISGLVRQSTTSERMQMKGLVPMRVDMIVIFCLKVDFILAKLGFDRFRISTFSLKEGTAVDIIEKHYKNKSPN